MIAAGEVTTFLLEHLIAEAAKPECPFPGTMIGDGVAPERAGWPAGQPNTGVFIPYLVLKAAGTITTTTGVPLCDSTGVIFPVNYQLVAYHNTRTDSDTLAEWSRTAVRADKGDYVIADLTVRMRQAAIDSMALATRDDSTFPKLWSSTTSFHVNATRNPVDK